MLSGVWRWIGARLLVRWTYLLLACLAVLVGLLLPSNYDTFITVKNATITHYFSGMVHATNGVGSGTAYLQTADGTLYYYAASDFTPALGTLQSTRVTLTYASQQMLLVDVQSTNSATHLAGRGFRVVALTSYDQSGQPSHIFTTNDYRQHPSGYYHIGIFSPAGFVLAFAGLLFLITLAFPLLTRVRSTGTCRSESVDADAGVLAARDGAALFAFRPGQLLPMPGLATLRQPPQEPVVSDAAPPSQVQPLSNVQQKTLVFADPSTSAQIHIVRPGLHDSSAYPAYPPAPPFLKPEPETPPALPAQPVPPQQTKRRVGTQFRRPGF
jgi:hypothetical protein